MRAEPNPDDAAGAQEGYSARRPHSTRAHIDVIGTAPSRNAPLRWAIAIGLVVLVAAGGAYLVRLSIAATQQVLQVRFAKQPPPARQTERPAPPATDAPRTAREASGAQSGEGGFDADVVLRLIARADPDAGAAAYKVCLVCHLIEPNAPHRVGPNLWGIVGARKAALPNFRYSQALKARGGTWSYRELAEYLHDTRNAVPGTSMAFFGIKDNQRMANLLAYLRTRADRPAPLPR